MTILKPLAMTLLSFGSFLIILLNHLQIRTKKFNRALEI
jgi:hypothetical protein